MGNMLIGVRRALLPRIGRIPYLLHDRFHTSRAAGAVNGTVAEPGPGIRVATDTDSKLTIAGGVLNLAPHSTPAWGDPGLWYAAFARTSGQVLLGIINISVDGQAQFGFDDNQALDLASGNYFYFDGIGNLYVRIGAAPWNVKVGLYSTSTKYELAIVLRTAGAYHFIKGGAFTEWTLVYIDSAQVTTPLYPAAVTNSATYTADNIRIPDMLWLPTPLAYDTFTRANGAIGTSEMVGPDSQAVAARTWVNRIGTTQIAANTASASALVGGIAIVTVDTGTIDTIMTAETTRAGGNVGTVLRYADTANYIYAMHDGTNAKLVKRVADAETDVISAVAAYAAGAEICVVSDGTSFQLFYNNAKIGATSVIADASLQTGTEQGLYSSNVGNSQDDFSVFPRGTGNEYNSLKRF